MTAHADRSINIGGDASSNQIITGDSNVIVIQSTEVRKGKLVTRSDFVDQSKDKHHILVGQRPRFQDLAEGCFIERQAVVESILESVRVVLNPHDTKPDRRIPVVWVVGSSGVGKSVLLLQAVRELVVAEDAKVNFLAHFVDQLPGALEHWSNRSESVVIAIDDIYSPENRQLEVWSKIHQIAFQGDWKRYPVILTCGPYDYKRAFEGGARRGGGLKLIPVEIPKLDDKEQERFQQWYQERTGETVPEINEPVFVLAAFLLELRRGGDLDIGEFAQRFGDRVRQLNVAEQILTSLAFNQLGLNVPTGLFRGKEEALEQLVREAVLRNSNAPTQSETVRVFHPRLAKYLYDYLVPSTETVARAKHFSSCCAESLDYPEWGVATFELLRKSRIRKQVPDAVVREALKHTWTALNDQDASSLNISLTLAWLKCAKELELDLDLLGVPSRINEWVHSPDVTPQVWGQLWQMAWACSQPSQRPELSAKGLCWLQDHASLPEWNYIWQEIWQEIPGDSVLIELARTWLEANTDSRGWGRVFQCLFDAEVREPWMLECGMSGLASSPVSSADPFIWSKIASLRADTESLTRHVTRRMCKATIPTVTEKGTQFVLSHLSTVGIESITDTLEGCIDDPGWPYAYSNLLEHLTSIPKGTERQFLAVGRAWLVGREHRVEWNYIWQRLIEKFPEDDNLWDQGRDWLVGREENPAWRIVKRKLDAAVGE